MVAHGIEAAQNGAREPARRRRHDARLDSDRVRRQHDIRHVVRHQLEAGVGEVEAVWPEEVFALIWAEDRAAADQSRHNTRALGPYHSGDIRRGQAVLRRVLPDLLPQAMQIQQEEADAGLRQRYQLHLHVIEIRAAERVTYERGSLDLWDLQA